MTAPWNVSLPTTLTVGGKEIPIRTDYRVALDCFLALTDIELDEYNRVMELLECLYEEPIDPQYWTEAIQQAMWYLNGGEPERARDTKQPVVVSWSQDFNLIAAPISKIIGQDIRGMEHLHWWTFLSAYMGIGDCLFSQVVAIRDKRARGKKLDKSDREFYRRNREIIDIKKPMTETEENILKEWV